MRKMKILEALQGLQMFRTMRKPFASKKIHEKRLAKVQAFKKKFLKQRT